MHSTNTRPKICHSRRFSLQADLCRAGQEEEFYTLIGDAISTELAVVTEFLEVKVDRYGVNVICDGEVDAMDSESVAALDIAFSRALEKLSKHPDIFPDYTGDLGKLVIPRPPSRIVPRSS